MPQNNTSVINIVIAGFGDIGQRLSDTLTANGLNGRQVKIFGIRRSPSPSTEQRQMVACDLIRMNDVDKQHLSALPEKIDVFLYTLTPSAYTAEGYQNAYVSGLKNILSYLEVNAYQVNHAWFISSSGVYAQNSGEWVNEESVTEPLSFSGKALLEAEKICFEFGGSVIRLSGIYGRGERNRYLENARQNLLYPKEPVQYSNRIHIEDVTGVITFLMSGALNDRDFKKIVLASDSNPQPLHKIQQWLMDKNNIQVDAEKAENVEMKRQIGSKRCDNSYLLHLGYRFKYPSFREGLAQPPSTMNV